ncbi:MAG: hypothetical protein AB7V50_04855, partial [Vampirovibrionia bacterium]
MKNKGSALAQYGIIIVLVVLGAVVAYSLLGQTIVDQLTSFLNFQKNNNAQMAENYNNTGSSSTSTTTAEPGSLGGTSTSPVENCNAGSCTVDYGDFILSGIPENYKDFVEVQGTSGGTDKLVSLVNQMADQLEEDGKPAEAQELRNFANLLSFMSDIEESMVNNIGSCQTDSDPAGCYLSNIKSNTITSVPSVLTDQGILTNYKETPTVADGGSLMHLSVGY